MTALAIRDEQRLADEPTCIYFIHSPDGIKIGSSDDPMARMRTLQIGSPTTLTMVGWVEAHRSDEQRAQELFGPWRIRGEWFANCPEFWKAFANARVTAELRRPPNQTGFVVDVRDGQLKLGGALRVDESFLVPTAKARAADWMAFAFRSERLLRDHPVRRAAEWDAVRTIVDRLRAHGGDPTTFEACPDLFDGKASA